MRTHSLRTSGALSGHSGTVTGSRAGRGALAVLALAATLGLAGCNYTFTAGAGLPAHVRTVAVIPFENETNRFELTQEVHEALLRQLPRALGLTAAGEDAADAVISGTILDYGMSAPLYQRGGGNNQAVEVLQREVVLSVSVEVLDQAEYVILWDNTRLRAVGHFLEASETEDVGRNEAIELLVQEIVDGVQSNW